jgi:hypothetical protein
MCAPAAAFLAHEPCPVNGEGLRVLQIGMDSVTRITVVYPKGWRKRPSAEDVAQSLEALRDTGDVRVTNATAIGQCRGRLRT